MMNYIHINYNIKHLNNKQVPKVKPWISNLYQN